MMIRLAEPVKSTKKCEAFQAIVHTCLGILILHLVYYHHSKRATIQYKNGCHSYFHSRDIGTTLSSTHASVVWCGSGHARLLPAMHSANLLVSSYLPCACKIVTNRRRLKGGGGGGLGPFTLGCMDPPPTTLGWMDWGSIHPGGSLQPPTSVLLCIHVHTIQTIFTIPGGSIRPVWKRSCLGSILILATILVLYGSSLRMVIVYQVENQYAKACMNYGLNCVLPEVLHRAPYIIYLFKFVFFSTLLVIFV